MITTVTYRGRIIEVRQFSVGWCSRIIPHVDIFQVLGQEAQGYARTPVEARKRAKKLIDEQDHRLSVKVKSYA